MLTRRPDKNTVWLEKDEDGETIIVGCTVQNVPVNPIIAHQENFSCNSFDYDFKEKIKSLRAGEKSSHTFPVPVRFDNWPMNSNSWRIVRIE